MKHMNMFGRISACGSISSYNTDVNTPPKGKHCWNTNYIPDTTNI